MALEKNGGLEEDLDKMREELNKYKSGMMNKEDGEDEGITADDAEGAGAHSESDGEVKQTTKRLNGTVDPEVMELRRQVWWISSISQFPLFRNVYQIKQIG